LKGDGTLTGTLTAPAGSIVEPGMPLGSLTVSGAAAISGTYLANLNRTNTPGNCSQFNSAGTTFTGATLSVTNLGSKLQAGDVFQLFPSGTSGFSSFAMQTVDAAHNAVYSWNNTVGTDGRITVASVGYAVNPQPTNLVSSVIGTNLDLSWPADHTGWILQTQTNSLSSGLGTNWVSVPASAGTNQVLVPINGKNGSVFFRMVFTNLP
jgi:hypothetical protein